MRMPTTVRSWIIILIGLAVILFAIRITGTADLEDNSQSRNVGYAMDLIERGNWLVQYDLQGHILSKPPLHTWLIGLIATPFGLNRMTMVLPSFLAVISMTLLVFYIGRSRYGLLAGGIAGLSVVLAPLLVRQMGMIRSDAVFALAVTAGAWVAFRAWETGRGWVVFWICAAVATLTKGPLGIVLAGTGLLACFWEGIGRAPLGGRRRDHVMGILVFTGICLAWILPALWFHGRALVDKMIFDELLGHVTTADNEAVKANFLLRISRPTANLMGRFVPFSLLAVWGLFRVFRWPDETEAGRRFERFLACWLLAGLLIFSLAAHHRADLLLPIWPAAALLAGREGARIGAMVAPRKLVWGTALISSLLILTTWPRYHSVAGKSLRSSVYSEQLRQAAMAFRQSGIDPGEVRYLGCPTTFQFYLGTARRIDDSEVLIKAQEMSDRPITVATGGDSIDPCRFVETDVKEVFRWPQSVGEAPVVRVFELRKLKRDS